jgi:uncharacterized protein
MHYTKKFFLSVGLVAILFIVGILAASVIEAPQVAEETDKEINDLPKIISVGDAIFNLELATDLSSRTKGLSDRPSLPEESGMLFIFNNPGNYGFWMKDMNFSIDIIWISNSTVVGYEKNVEPEGNFPSQTYFPPVPVTEVLEINAGLVDRLGIEVGDVVKLLYERGEI